MRHKVTAFTTLVLLGTNACSSSDSPTDPEETGGTFTATLDGQAWTGQIDALATYYNGFAFSLFGTDGDVDIGLIVQLTDPDITLPGTVDLTHGSTGAHVQEGGDVWHAAGMGGSGTMTVTELTESRATVGRAQHLEARGCGECAPGTNGTVPSLRSWSRGIGQV